MTKQTEEWVTVAVRTELSEGSTCTADVHGREIAIYNVDGQYYATDDVCTHAYARLSLGFLERHEIECPLHFGRFDIRTGKGLCAPIESDLRTYKVRVEGNNIQILAVDALA